MKKLPFTVLGSNAGDGTGFQILAKFAIEDHAKQFIVGLPYKSLQVWKDWGRRDKSPSFIIGSVKYI